MKKHLTYANVAATIALILAIGGGSFAVAKTAKIGTKQLKSAAVTEPKLRDGAVSAAKLRDGVIGGTKLTDQSINALKLGQVQVVSSNPTVGSADVGCPTGAVLLSGGGSVTAGAGQLTASARNADRWVVSASGGATVVAQAFCLL